MPLSPSDIDARITADSRTDFTTLCHEIDEVLVEGRRYNRTTITVGVADIPRTFIDRTIDTYTPLGWTVKLVYDDRDGNFLTFERT